MPSSIPSPSPTEQPHDDSPPPHVRSGDASAGTADSSSAEVIVLDEEPVPPAPGTASPGRSSSRLRAKRAARVLRQASHTAKRVGPALASEPSDDRRKKRKASHQPSSPFPAVPFVEAPADTDALVRTLSAAVARTMPSADLATCEPAGSGRHRFSSSSAVPTDLGPTGSDATATPFNLESFAQAFAPNEFAPPAPPADERLTLSDRVDQLFDLFTALRRNVLARTAQHPHTATPVFRDTAPPLAAPLAAADARESPPSETATWTLAPLGNSADMPPTAVCQLRYESFPAPHTHVRGEYYPPAAHRLAAHRLSHDLNTTAGRWATPMSFVLHVRELACVRFDAPPAVLMALYSGRLGSRGLTVLPFRPQSELEQLERGSTNANFSTDFGAGAALPATEARSSSYEDLLAAVSGLISFSDTLWYDHARRMLCRLKRFVVAN
ncbi:hypothetical protein PHMEG_00021561 [Phytophthora megakarya]|uniref:Uncharacterized protein n=1 Tax=Phytophthora megakarya TaxID=4795 RepID=A0A225VN81_9STRA|nr:hypothetical protein PHMEG_00021561 [Phytophthora megakarya]